MYIRIQVSSRKLTDYRIQCLVDSHFRSYNRIAHHFPTCNRVTLHAKLNTPFFSQNHVPHLGAQQPLQLFCAETQIKTVHLGSLSQGAVDSTGFWAINMFVASIVDENTSLTQKTTPEGDYQFYLSHLNSLKKQNHVGTNHLPKPILGFNHLPSPSAALCHPTRL